MKQIFFAILLSLFVVSAISAQENTNNDSGNNRVRKTDNSSLIRKTWVEKDVAYIITSEEKKAFNALQTDEERENFIENFWQRRDPDPDTEVNEFREEYYERIRYANENFASGIPGWQTDRGWIYISYGQPNKIEKGRADFGNLKNIVFETWFYNYLDSFCSKYQFTFTDPIKNNSFLLSDEDREKLLKLSANGLVQCYGGF